MSRLLNVLERVIAPDDSDMAPDVARGVLELHFSEADKARYLDLAGRHNEGSLTAEELDELKAFVDANSILSVLKLKAKHSLAKSQPAA